MLEARRAEAGIVLIDDPVQIPIKEPPRQDQLRPFRQSEADYEVDQVKRRIQHNLFSIGQAAGARYRGCRLENFQSTTVYQKRAIEMIREYGHSLKDRQEAREGLVMYGPVGTGKDHLAYALAIYAASQGVNTKWFNGQEWFGSIRDAIDSSRSESSIIDEIERPDLLVISDPLPPIGDLTQHQATMFYRAIESRYAEGKLTITTINVADDKEADRRMGAPTWDRLCHGAWKIHCCWASFRKPARELKP